MANEIRIKRRAAGGAAGAPSSLKNGELAFNEQDLILYYGFGDAGGGVASSVITIGGNGAYVTVGTTQTITGAKTFSSLITGSVSGNAGTATALQTSRTISLGTDLGGSAGFDGTSNITINATIQNNAVTAVKIADGNVTMPKLNITGGTSVTPVNADEIPIYDASATSNGKVSITNLSSLISTNVTSTFSASAGPGLSVTNSFTGLNYSLNVTALTSLTTVSSGDILLIYDIANSTYKKITKSDLVAGLGVGNVTSVALSAPAEFTVSGSPVTGSGTLTFTKANQTTNTVYAAPNGSTGAPTFRLLVAADIPTLTAAKISDFDTQVRTSRLDQMAAPTAAVSFNSQRITNLADPTNPQDAATKAYVDAYAAGLDFKESVRVATTANITLSGTQTIDGIAVTAGQRVLVKDQSTASANGIYTVAAGAWTRATDADSSAEVTTGTIVFVEEGTTNATSQWVLSTTGTITLGTTNLTFVQFSGAGQITAGNGLSKTGNTLTVVGTANRISVSGAGVDISASYVGQTSITTLGTITTGVWTGTAIAVANGGTGATTQSDARTNLGLGTIATQNANAVAITGGSITGLTTFDNNAVDGGTF